MNSVAKLHQGVAIDLWYDAASPEVSIIVLNFNKSDLTRESLRRIWAHTYDRRYEIIVVDNGSTADEFWKLSEFAGDFQLLRLPVNRYFGEGNNIGVEASRGRYVVFLNNDALVTDNWLEPLIDLLEKQSDAGGVGPKFLYPDGRIQEAGAFIDDRGLSIQRGKVYNLEPAILDSVGTVDYCSAACFAVSRDIFDRVSGFDPTFEPAYYEDADLCFKIASLGLFIYYCPYSVVHHIENATTSALWRDFENVKENNRQKFLSRWGNYLVARANGRENSPPPFAPPPRTIHSPHTRDQVAVFHSPFDLVACGRERYVLTAACALNESHHVYVATDAPYSNYRLDHLARELCLDLSRISMITRRELYRLHPVDIFFHIGNEPFPYVPPMGRRNFYMCQFPCPVAPQHWIDRWENLRGYDCVLVYSHFVRDSLRGINAFRFGPAIELLSPPVPISPLTTKRTNNPSGQPIVISIGRFRAGGQSKRHDVLIEGIKRLSESGINAELHLVGALQPHSGSEQMAHYAALCQKAEGLPVHFHANAAPDDLADLLSRASIYWHAVGFETDPTFNPEQCEHFGVSILEAMSAGCIPFVVSNGAPVEFVREDDTGFQFATLEELVAKTRAVLREPARAAVVRERAIQKAREFADPAFLNKWRKIAIG
jgi:GT2 family glycosyltransferase/glycosyltransferase involved in cell wall biosynthesis